MGGRSKFTKRVGMSIFAGCTVGLLALGSPVKADAILEDFEEPNNIEGQYPYDWDVIQERIVLGDSILAGCPSPDNATYSTLSNLVERGAPYGPNTVPSFGSTGSATHVGYPYYVEWWAPGETTQYVLDGLPVWWDSFYGDFGFGPNDDSEPDSYWGLSDRQKLAFMIFQAENLRDKPEIPTRPQYDEGFDVTVLDGQGYGINWNSQVLQLYSWVDSYAGHVIHGPAVVSSDTLKIENGEATLEFWFSAARDMDNYHVYGYLQSLDCSTEVEVLDTTGDRSGWQHVVKKDIPIGEYRFVFVSGTYDETWGGLGGAKLWIDDISCRGEGNGSCVVIDCVSDCDSVDGSGLTTDELKPLPEDSTWSAEYSFSYSESPSSQATETGPTSLPTTGTDRGALGLAASLLLLGIGVLAVRRRVAVIALRR